MIKALDIYGSIKALLENSFPEIFIQIKDIKTPSPPCFYIRYIASKSTQSAQNYENNNHSFEIIYFAQEENLLELFEIKEKLNKVLKFPLKIELQDGLVQYQEIDSITITLNEKDYSLNCKISMNIDQKITPDNEENRYSEYDNDELIEEIEI